MKKRPIGVTILAVLAGIAAVLAALRVLQYLSLLPFFFGPFSFHSFSLMGAIMWALMVWVYIWLMKALWEVQPEAWMFLVIITIFDLILVFVEAIGGNTLGNMMPQVVVNGIILIYCMLPGVKNAFDASRYQ